jgi:hypothetical protein
MRDQHNVDKITMGKSPYELPCRLQVDRVDYLWDASIIRWLDHIGMAKWISCTHHKPPRHNLGT